MEIVQNQLLSWAGVPQNMVIDRDTHNRGELSKMLSQSGAQIVPIGLESSEQLGITERHGGLWKALARRVISARRIHGPEQMRT